MGTQAPDGGPRHHAWHHRSLAPDCRIFNVLGRLWLGNTLGREFGSDPGKGSNSLTAGRHSLTIFEFDCIDLKRN